MNEKLFYHAVATTPETLRGTYLCRLHKILQSLVVGQVIPDNTSIDNSRVLDAPFLQRFGIGPVYTEEASAFINAVSSDEGGTFNIFGRDGNVLASAPLGVKTTSMVATFSDDNERVLTCFDLRISIQS
jgi:hypothetical protein